VLPGGSEARRFVYGGVSFDVAGDYPHTGVDTFSAGSVSGTPSVAAVACSVARGQVTRPPVDPHGHCLPQSSWSGDRGRIRDQELTALVRRIGRLGGVPNFVATVELDSSKQTQPGAVERALSHELLEYRGGLMLHAAAVEVDGKVVAFTGPKAAGKTTACLLTQQPWFSRDRLAIAPTNEGWWAWPLRGGHTPTGLPRSSARALPLGAVLRVSASRSGRSSIEEDVHSTEAIFDIRQTCVPAMRSTRREERRLAAIEELLKNVPFARILTVLGHSPLPEIRKVLSRA
jgi:hypothetical protein